MVPPGAALGIHHFWDASWDRSFGRFGSILAPFWKIFGRFFGRICRPTCLLKLTTVQLVIKHAARWRVRSFAALWIRTGPEGAQLRVCVQRQVICRESVGSLHVRFLSSKILGGNRGQAELGPWDRAPLETAQDAPKTPQVDLLFFITFSMPFGIDFLWI